MPLLRSQASRLFASSRFIVLAANSVSSTFTIGKRAMSHVAVAIGERVASGSDTTHAHGADGGSPTATSPLHSADEARALAPMAGQTNTAGADETRALAFLREHGVAFTVHRYAYEEKGGTRRSSQELGVPEHIVVKTLVFESGPGAALVCLMHGDYKVDTKKLAKALNVRRVYPCAPEDAQRVTGYRVGGTSPFGLATPLPLYAERTIFDLPRIYINGGGRGLLVALDPREIIRTLSPTLVDVGLPQ